MEEEDDKNLSTEQRVATEPKAEKALCDLTAKLILYIAAKIVNNNGSEAGKLHRRIKRNQSKLGNNYKSVGRVTSQVASEPSASMLSLVSLQGLSRSRLPAFFSRSDGCFNRAASIGAARGLLAGLFN